MEGELSYWTKRRRIQQQVSVHLESLRKAREIPDIERPAHAEYSGFALQHTENSTVCHDSEINQKTCGAVCEEEQVQERVSWYEHHPFQQPCSSGSDSDVTNSAYETKGHDYYQMSSKLAKWAVDFKISHNAINSLMEILLKYHPSLPKDARTLLSTPRYYDIKQVAGGSYHYFGVEALLVKVLSHKLTTRTLKDGEHIVLQINIDGLPLFKSSNSQFWPILARVSHPVESEPFIIALYCGSHKPGNVSEYLLDFVTEMNIINENGIVIDGKKLQVQVSSFVCDAPARSFVKQVKGHNAYYGCEKCTQRGVWKGKVTFPSLDASLRTDDDFKSLADEEHHYARSPLIELGIGMVSQFPYDYMHLVCLGVTRKLIGLWIRGPVGKNCRVGSNVIQRISDDLLKYWKFLPSEFPRKCRSLAEVDRWKATEYRQFLLYSGPIALKDKLADDKYQNFLDLFVGIYCLASPFYYTTHCQYAHELLCTFVQDFGRIYGSDMLVYNVHGLSHLAGDVANFGPLDRFSAFPFENFLGKLKAKLRKPNFPVQQVICRLHEEMNALLSTEPKKHVDVEVPKHMHNNGPLPGSDDNFLSSRRSLTRNSSSQ
ncbi:uncharacterized protein LOC126992284 [Eriocheir sinensis]|uniref:uncharacterized protein LOC126992284 n=1 Tax=Eriocheir sinensis TaxID=95602 RepID=UPI0021C93311|nr:uncharacterized protein LOC126992284 [Eriocheir sinensis]